MSLTAEQAAKRLGMKLREIVAVAGDVVTTHDGTSWLVADGEITRVERPAAASDAAPPADDTVPAGPVDAVIAWIGTDADRAKRAQTVEIQLSRPRKKVMAAAAAVLAGDNATPAAGAAPADAAPASEGPVDGDPADDDPADVDLADDEDDEDDEEEARG